MLFSYSNCIYCIYILYITELCLHVGVFLKRAMQVLASVTDSIHTRERVLSRRTQTVLECSWDYCLSFSLISFFFFCSLSSSVLTPLSHKFSPHYSKDLKHEIGLPACGCQIPWWYSMAYLIDAGWLEARDSCSEWHSHLNAFDVN